VNVDHTTHRSQPLQLSNNQSFYMPQVNGLIPLKGHTSIVINCKNYVCIFSTLIFLLKILIIKNINLD